MKSGIDRMDTAKYQEYLKANFKDPAQVIEFNKQTLYRARRTAIILGIVLILGLLAVVFAFVQNVKSEYVMQKQSKLKDQLEICIQEAQKQQGLAMENMMILQEANKMAEEQLQACQAKK